MPMKPKSGFDPEFAAESRPRPWSIRLTGLLMILVIVLGLALVNISIRRPRPLLHGRAGPYFLPTLALTEQPGQVVLTSRLLAQESEHFVIMAPPEIDPEMVVPAPSEIDQAMVITPSSGQAPQVLTVPPLAPEAVAPENPWSVPNRPAPRQDPPLPLAPARAR
jgi:hypothetical protein